MRMMIGPGDWEGFVAAKLRFFRACLGFFELKIPDKRLLHFHHHGLRRLPSAQRRPIHEACKIAAAVLSREKDIANRHLFRATNSGVLSDGGTHVGA